MPQGFRNRILASAMAMGNHKNAKHTYLPFFHLQADFSDVQYKNVGIFGFATSREVLREFRSQPTTKRGKLPKKYCLRLL
tara:strand:+ start:270 stop:509 length:240 start_codon:yes stop_codon:yes gene_type:complete